MKCILIVTAMTVQPSDVSTFSSRYLQTQVYYSTSGSIERLTVLLRLPDVIASEAGERVGSTETLCVALNKLHMPT